MAQPSPENTSQERQENHRHGTKNNFRVAAMGMSTEWE